MPFCLFTFTEIRTQLEELILERIKALSSEQYAELYAQGKMITIKNYPLDQNWEEDVMGGPVEALIKNQIREEI